RLLADSRGSLTVFADPAQAIYPSGWHWAQAALRVRGGSTHWLRKSYRTTREIFALARPLLEQHEDLAEELEQLEPPVRHGKRPVLVVAPSEQALRRALVQRLQAALQQWSPGQIGVLAATWLSLEALEPALRAAGVPCRLLRPGEMGVKVETPEVKLLSIASAKGLDFPVIVLWGPHRWDLGGWKRAAEPETRRTLYVALTRAGAELTIGVSPASSTRWWMSWRSSTTTASATPRRRLRRRRRRKHASRTKHLRHRRREERAATGGSCTRASPRTSTFQTALAAPDGQPACLVPGHHREPPLSKEGSKAAPMPRWRMITAAGW